MADAHRSALGGLTTCAKASQRTVVPWTRLSRMLAFFAAVQRPAAMLSPARCTTTSRPSRAGVPILRAAGFQGISACPGRGVDRTNRVTVCPPAVNVGTRAEPMNPLAPLTSTCIDRPPSLKLLPIGDRAIVQKDMGTPVKIRPLLNGPRSAWDADDFVWESPAHRHFTPGHTADDLLTLDKGTHLRAYGLQRRFFREDYGEFFRDIVEGAALRLHTDTEEGNMSRDACQDILTVQPDNGDRTPQGDGHWRSRRRGVEFRDSVCKVNEIVLVVTIRVDKHGRIEWLLHITLPKGLFLTAP